MGYYLVFYKLDPVKNQLLPIKCLLGAATHLHCSTCGSLLQKIYLINQTKHKIGYRCLSSKITVYCKNLKSATFRVLYHLNCSEITYLCF